MIRPLTRRRFLRGAALGASGLLLTQAPTARTYAANEKLNVALIGVGGRGKWFVDTMPRLSSVVAICDVRDSHLDAASKAIPAAKRFHDYRQLLAEMTKEIEGVVIAGPDHMHAPAASMAMKMGKHVYCEKPLTNTVHESRHLRELATKMKVTTQMGNQGTATEAFRRACELIQAGVIGQVREVYAWNDGGGAGPHPVPKEPWHEPPPLKWDLWLGPSPDRPYHPDWLKWRAWREFGTAQLGNWAVHTTNLAFKALKLEALWRPDAFPASDKPAAATFSVQAQVAQINPGTFPRWEVVTYEFPARGELPPVKLHWCNGSRVPQVRGKIEELLGRQLDWGDAGERKWKDHAGLLLLGSKGKLHTTGHNASFTLLPEDQFKTPPDVARSLPRSRGHEQEWLDACRGGPAAMSSFDYGGPLSEFVLFGNVATQFKEKLEFDPVQMKVVNVAAANDALRREYRKGWEL